MLTARPACVWGWNISSATASLPGADTVPEQGLVFHQGYAAALAIKPQPINSTTPSSPTEMLGTLTEFLSQLDSRKKSDLSEEGESEDLKIFCMSTVLIQY